MAQIAQLIRLDRVMERYGNMLGSLSQAKQNIVFMRTLNAEGDRMRSHVRRAVKQQTNLKAKVITKAIKRRGASVGDLSYELKTKGGDIRLRYFVGGVREGKGGVTARPRGQKTFYAGGFTKSGRQGARKPNPRLHGHAYRNTEGRKWRGKIAVIKSGVFIPQELVRDESAAAFARASALIMQQIGRQLAAVFRGF